MPKTIFYNHILAKIKPDLIHLVTCHPYNPHRSCNGKSIPKQAVQFIILSIIAYLRWLLLYPSIAVYTQCVQPCSLWQRLIKRYSMKFIILLNCGFRLWIWKFEIFDIVRISKTNTISRKSWNEASMIFCYAISEFKKRRIVTLCHKQKKKLTKKRMAAKMNTSRSSLDRLLDPNNESVPFSTLRKAANAVGKRLVVRLA